ncbi:MAG: transcriptional repressor [Lachnospiraceae bacterium]|nr:transcriptional repressor [Lachnospiraceae bacterium]
MNLKHSKQRDAIKNFLMTRKDHPTADVVYENVRKEFPNISLGTVYRNLTLLSDKGELLRLRVGDGVDHFDATTTPHYHFVCKKCCRVLDLDFDTDMMNSINDMAQKSFSGLICEHVTYFYGTCEDCENSN